MSRKFSRAAAVALVALFASAALPATSGVAADDALGQVIVVPPDTKSAGSLGVDGVPAQAPIVTQSVVRSFRAAPQNGSNNLLVGYTCEAVASGAVVRTMISSCRGVSDLGGRYQFPGPVTQGGAGYSAGTVTIPGNRLVAVCVAVNVRYANGQLYIGPETCFSG